MWCVLYSSLCPICVDVRLNTELGMFDCAAKTPPHHGPCHVVLLDYFLLFGIFEDSK